MVGTRFEGNERPIHVRNCKRYLFCHHIFFDEINYYLRHLLTVLKKVVVPAFRLVPAFKAVYILSLVQAFKLVPSLQLVPASKIVPPLKLVPVLKSVHTTSLEVGTTLRYVPTLICANRSNNTTNVYFSNTYRLTGR